MSLPTLALDPATLGDLDADLAREWLVTNGLGGYAMGSVCGATTRSYHGLLVAAVRPPVDRAVLITKVDETVTLPDASRVELGTNEYAGGAIAPHGFARLEGFALVGSIPRWTFRLSDGIALEKSVWMAHGYNATFVRYRYVAAAHMDSIQLTLTPFCLDRDHHGVTQGALDWRFLVDTEAAACTIRAFTGALPYRIIAGPAARFTATGEWHWHVFHRAEHERGLPDTEDVYQPGTFTITLAPGQTASLLLSAGTSLPPELAGIGGERHEATVADAYEREQARCADLLSRAGARVVVDAMAARLALAADQFLVARPVPTALPAPTEPQSLLSGISREASSVSAASARDDSITVIAGYPWFTDWGRDTMIALPGLTLTTGRHADAGGLLRTFARYISQGMLPNRFPDGGAAPEYNTVDATLWYFVAIGRYLDATGDEALLSELFPSLADIIAWHLRGTRFGIGVDPADGLLRAGASGVQLTWMDAKVDDWVVTPRRGKPVEINALWYAALSRMAAWARRLGAEAGPYDAALAAVERSYWVRFWYEAGGYLYDVVDVEGQPGTVDSSFRPNQLFALSLAHPLIPLDKAQHMLMRIEERLLTPMGLRTLAPDDPRYIGIYTGDQRSRDAAYHQGTVWPWLLGAYADALLALYGAAAHARIRALLPPFEAHLRTAGVGTISEIACANPPFAPCGCIAQAWSVAELLRMLALLDN